jgi:2,4-dienoyl-CoA reductase-like NADH-dependent reductase (Old Yellow Enzyme family)
MPLSSMPLPETISTFVHYITQICALGVAYVQLVRYIPFMDQPLQPEQLHEGEPEGQYKRGIPHDALAVYGPLVKLSRAIMADHREQQMRGLALPPKAAGSVRTRLLLNGALPPREADALIADGLIDGAVFGQLWIGNPDLQRRIEAGLDVDGKGINECTNMKAFHYTTNGNPHQGYTDYPTYPRDHSHPEKPKRTVSASAELDAAAIARKRTKSDAHAMS